MPDKFQIQVNGQARMWRKGGTVAELLHELDLTTERVAVELNLEILDRAAFAGRPLQEGDRVEILSFIGGGSQRGGRFVTDTVEITLRKKPYSAY